MVNGKRVNIPSFSVKPGSAVEVHDKSKKILRIQEAIQAVDRSGIHQWPAGHKEANVAPDGVMRGYGLSYLPSSTAAQLAVEASVNIAVLRGLPPGTVDFFYMEMQVRQHAAAVVLLDQLYTVVGEGAMGAYVLETKAMVDDHLDRAADLLSTYY